MRISTVLLTLLRVAKQRRVVRPEVTEDELPAGLRRAMLAVSDAAGTTPQRGEFAELDAAEAALALATWSTMLGAVGAELFGHLPPPAGLAPAELFEFTMAGSLARLGLDLGPWQRAAAQSPSS